jgi:hypothetical protein
VVAGSQSGREGSLVTGTPPLYRAWKVLQLLSTLVVVGVVLFTIAAAYSAGEMVVHGLGASSGPDSAGPTVRLGSTLEGSSLAETLGFPIPNHGFLPIDGISVTGGLANGTNGTIPVGTVSGGPVSVPAGSTGNLTLVAMVSLEGPVGLYLDTHNGSLGTDVWLNVSYAYLYGLAVRVNFTLPWTPPFANLTFVAAPFVPQPNGTNATNVTVGFGDLAPGLDLAGTLGAQFVDALGTACASMEFPIHAGNGLVSVTEPAWFARTCPATGEVVSSTFSSPTSSVALPAEAMM